MELSSFTLYPSCISGPKPRIPKTLRIRRLDVNDRRQMRDYTQICAPSAK